MIFFILFLSLMTAWCLFSFSMQVDSYFLPSPASVMYYMAKNWRLLGHHGLLTLTEISGGLVLGLIASLVTGFRSHHYPRLQQLLMSFFRTMQAVPMLVLLPLLGIWLGKGMASKMMLVALSSYSLMAASLLQGLSSCPTPYRDLAHTFHALPRMRWRHLLLPSALPCLLNGMRLALGYALLMTLTVDWMGAHEGLGYLIMLGHERVQLDMMFAGILLFILLALMLNMVISAIQYKLLYWKTENL